MFLVDDLLIGLPIKGLVGILQKIAEMAEDELTDGAKIREELQLLLVLYETDQISEEEYERRESALLERLTMMRDEEND
ncbi:MAG TPA: gas vesicle protein GvpG [Ktedonobacteraceae bacterium]|jgi:hypothetical protein|nr:gas vesicle protein GvpG [Ktedonobacteraceae bacterium]